MFSSDIPNNYDEIMLSFKEKCILHRIYKKKEVLDDFCNEAYQNTFLSYGLIRFEQKPIRMPNGRITYDTSSPRRIQATDKALRYFIYRKETFFEGKFPVIIAFIALLKACDKELVKLFHLITDLITRL